jgi:cbb3-type cytochrome oxidase subunit 3
MMNNGNGEMHMGDYSFMGMHPFWLVLVLVLLFFMLVLFNRFRKKNK